VKTLTLRAWITLGVIVLALLLTMSWCADRARLKTMRGEATVGAATGKALDTVATETPVIRQQQAEKQREVEKIEGADQRLPAGFGADLERVRRGTGASNDPRQP
jgi:type VI protein secretion system component VasK